MTLKTNCNHHYNDQSNYDFSFVCNRSWYPLSTGTQANNPSPMTVEQIEACLLDKYFLKYCTHTMNIYNTISTTSTSKHFISPLANTLSYIPHLINPLNQYNLKRHNHLGPARNKLVFFSLLLTVFQDWTNIFFFFFFFFWGGGGFLGEISAYMCILECG